MYSLQDVNVSKFLPMTNPKALFLGVCFFFSNSPHWFQCKTRAFHSLVQCKAVQVQCSIADCEQSKGGYKTTGISNKVSYTLHRERYPSHLPNELEENSVVRCVCLRYTTRCSTKQCNTIHYNYNSIQNIIFFSVCEQAEFNISCNLIGSWGGRNFLLQTATPGGIRRVDQFSWINYR